MEPNDEPCHAHTTHKGEYKAYICAGCSKPSTSPWSSRWLTSQASYCAHCSPPNHYESNNCPKGHQLEFVRSIGRIITCGCCKEYTCVNDRGKWMCVVCNFNLCTKCKPAPCNDQWKVIAMCGHSDQRCPGCGGWLRARDLALECQECHFFVCLNCSRDRTMLVGKLIRVFYFLANVRIFTEMMTQKCINILPTLIKMGLRIESLHTSRMSYPNRLKYAEVLRLCPDLSDLHLNILHQPISDWKEDDSLAAALKDQKNLVSFAFTPYFDSVSSYSCHFQLRPLRNALLSCPALEVVHFHSAEGYLEELAELAINSSSLRELWANHAGRVKPKDFVSFVRAVKQSKSIVNLGLQYNCVDAPTEEAIVDELKDSEKLEVVDMTGCYIEAERIWKIEDNLAAHGCRIRFLFNSTYGDAKSVHFTERSECYCRLLLLLGLARNSALEELYLKNYEFKSTVSDKEITTCFCANKPHLRSVRITSCSLAKPKAVLLAKQLSALPMLEELDLSYLGIGDLGGIEIARNLRSHPTLKRGRFRANRFRSKVGVAFIAMLKENHTIQYLDISNNKLGEQFSRYPIDKHPSLLELVVGANVIVKLTKKKKDA